jgi:hypothetical protein
MLSTALADAALQLSEQKSDTILQGLDAPLGDGDMMGRYCTSKLLEILVVREFARRSKQQPSKAHAVISSH